MGTCCGITPHPQLNKEKDINLEIIPPTERGSVRIPEVEEKNAY